MKKLVKILALQVFISTCSYAQTFQKSYSTGTFQNQQNTKGYDVQASANGYAAFSEDVNEKHLILTDPNGVYQNALRFGLTQNNLLGEGSTFVQVTNGDYFVAGILNGNMVLTSVNAAGALSSYETYSLSVPAAISEFHQIIQVEKYNDEYVYIRGIHKFQAEYTGGSPNPLIYRHFLCQAKRLGQAGNYQYAVQWIKTLGAGDVNPNLSLLNHDGKFGDMHVSKLNGSVYYVGKDLSTASANTHWDVEKFDINGNVMFWRRYNSGANDYEPTSVVEPPTGLYIYVCGFNNAKSFASRINKNTGAHSWTRVYTPAQGYSGLKFRAIEYSTLTNDANRLKIAGEVTHAKKFAVTTQLEINSGTPFSLNAYYNYTSINEIVQEGTTNFMMVGNVLNSNNIQQVNAVGLIKTDQFLNTDCSHYVTQPTPSIQAASNYTLAGTTSLEFLQLIMPEGNASFITYSENSACCKLSLNSQTVYLCPSPGTAVLDPGVFTNYFWSNGDKTRSIEVTQPGSYHVTVFDENGCWGVIYYTVIGVPPIGLSVNPTPITCNGANNGNYCFNTLVNIVSASVIYPGSGGAQTVPINNNNFCFYNLIGFTANPGLAPGYYAITVYDQYGCSETFTANLTQPSPIVITYTATLPTTGNCDATLTFGVTGGTPGYILTVNGPGGYFYNGTPFTTLVNLCSGCYTTSVVDANGCLANLSGCAAVPDQGGKSISTGIESKDFAEEVLLSYPNPVDQVLTIEVPGADTIEFYNAQGKLVKSIKTESKGSIYVNVEDLASGIYLVKTTKYKTQARIIKH